MSSSNLISLIRQAADAVVAAVSATPPPPAIGIFSTLLQLAANQNAELLLPANHNATLFVFSDAAANQTQGLPANPLLLLPLLEYLILPHATPNPQPQDSLYAIYATALSEFGPGRNHIGFGQTPSILIYSTSSSSSASTSSSSSSSSSSPPMSSSSDIYIRGGIDVSLPNAQFSNYSGSAQDIENILAASSARIMQSYDLTADKGMLVHIIDKVITPPALLEPSLEAIGHKEYISWLTSNPKLAAKLRNLQSLTYFVPASSAFSRFLTAPQTLALLKSNGNITLTHLKPLLLLHHIIPGVFTSTFLSSRSSNFTLPTYLNTSITLTTPKDLQFQGFKIIVKDIFIDQGVIHIIDDFDRSPNPIPQINSLSHSGIEDKVWQVYPEGYTPPPMDTFDGVGKDIPAGAIVGGIVGAVFLIVMGAIVAIVIRRRKMIVEMERRRREKEEQEEEENREDKTSRLGGMFTDIHVSNEHGKEAVHGDSGTGWVTATDFGNERIQLDDLSSHPLYHTQSAIQEENEDEEDMDEESDEEDEEDETNKIKHTFVASEREKIMQIRRDQWMQDTPPPPSPSSSSSATSSTTTIGGDASKRHSLPSKKRVSLIIPPSATPATETSASTTYSQSQSQRPRSLSQAHPQSHKRASYAPSTKSTKSHLNTNTNRYSKHSTTTNTRPRSMILDPKELSKEKVRESWWSATGVGKGTSDIGVIEAQMERSERRKSWWSGSGEGVYGDHDDGEGGRERMSIASRKSQKRVSRFSGVSFGHQQQQQQLAVQREKRLSWWSNAAVPVWEDAGPVVDFAAGNNELMEDEYEEDDDDDVGFDADENENVPPVPPIPVSVLSDGGERKESALAFIIN